MALAAGESCSWHAFGAFIPFFHTRRAKEVVYGPTLAHCMNTGDVAGKRRLHHWATVSERCAIVAMARSLHHAKAMTAPAVTWLDVPSSLAALEISRVSTLPAPEISCVVPSN